MRQQILAVTTFGLWSVWRRVRRKELLEKAGKSVDVAVKDLKK